MALSESQKVDFLLKKIGYTASKTGLSAEEGTLTGTKKAGFAEAIPSPLKIADSSIWAESEHVPSTPPTSNSDYVGVSTGANAVHMTVDSTVASNRAFVARATWNDQTSANTQNWIDTQYGTDYLIKVWMGNPTGVSTALSAGGSGSNDEWFFDYASGVLNFNGTNVPTGISTSNIYIEGYRYIGKTGVPSPGDSFKFDNLYVAGISTFVGIATFRGGITVHAGVSTFAANIDANAGITANTLKVEDLTDNRIVLAGTGGEVEDSANLTFNGTLFNVGQTTGISSILDEDNFASDSATALATQQSIKAYVGSSAPGGSNLAVSADSGSNQSINLNTEVLDIEGTSNEIETVTGTNKVVIGLPNDVTISNNLTVTNNTILNGNIDLGNATGDTITATGRFDSNLIPNANETYNLGSSTLQWNNVYAKNVGIGTSTSLTDDIVTRNLKATGITTLATAQVSDLTSGRVVYAGTGGELQDSSNFTYDGTTLSVTGNVSIGGTLTYEDVTSVDSVGLATARIGLRVLNGGIVVNAGVSTFSALVDINNGGQANTFKVEDLTAGRVVLAGTGGEIEDSNKLTFDGSKLEIVGHVETDTLQVAGVSTFAGAIDGNAGAHITGVSTIANLKVGSITATAILDEDNMASDSAAALATQQSIKAYVDSNVTAQDLDFQAGSGGALSVDLDSETLHVLGTANEIETSGSSSGIGNTITIGLPDDVTISGDLTVNKSVGITSDLHVTGLSTFVGVTTFPNSNVYIQQELWVAGQKVTGGGPVVGNDINARHIKATGISTFLGDTTIGLGGTTITADVSHSRVGINSTAPTYTLDVGGIINSSTDVRINGVSVSGGASLDDVTALAIALG